MFQQSSDENGEIDYERLSHTSAADIITEIQDHIETFESEIRSRSIEQDEFLLACDVINEMMFSLVKKTLHDQRREVINAAHLVSKDWGEALQIYAGQRDLTFKTDVTRMLLMAVSRTKAFEQKLQRIDNPIALPDIRELLHPPTEEWE